MKKILFLLFAVPVLFSCGSVKEVAYLQDVGVSEALQAFDNNYEITIQPSDQLSILVNVLNKDNAALAAPFNSFVVMAESGAAGQVANMSGATSYLVDAEGYINFPVFGKIQVAGMTRGQLVSYLENRLRDEDYIKEPVVTVGFLNLKVYVMGEVTKPGPYPIVSNCMTVFEALSTAGDLTIYGQRRNVMVIRVEDGVRKIVKLDLTSKKIFESPYFYLQQNDVIYVTPNKRRAEQGAVSPLTSALLSGGSILVSIGTLIATILRYR